MDKKQEIERIENYLNGININVSKELRQELENYLTEDFTISNKKLDAIVRVVNEWERFINKDRFPTFFQNTCCYGVKKMLKLHTFALTHTEISKKIPFIYLSDNIPQGLSILVTENGDVMIKSQQGRELIKI